MRRLCLSFCAEASVGLVVAVALLLGGCAHTPPARPGAGQPGQIVRFDMEPMKLEVVRGPTGARVEAFDAATLFEQAGQDLGAGRFAEAAAAYDRIVKDFADSRLVLPALYNGGLAYEGLRDYDQAAARYRQVVSRKPDGRDATDALFRLGACLAEAQKWRDSLAIFDQLLKRADLSLSDRIEAMSRRGLAQVELSELTDAERTFRETMAYFKDNEEKERLDSDFYLAMSQFYLGNISHRLFRAMPLRLPQRQLEEDVESKAKMFLAAQSRYIDAIRIQNPVWATASGFQIGTLYKEMYDLLLNAPVPAELDTELKREVYRDLLKEKLRVLLTKARRIHEKNVEMAERIGVDNDWVKRSGDQLAELETLLESMPDKDGEQATRDGLMPKAPPAPGQAPAAKPKLGAPGTPAAPRSPAAPRPAPDYRPRNVL